jgi:hypothetical protein
MRHRRVLLCLPDQPSEEVLTVARTVKAALAARFQVRLRLPNEVEEDDELTPVDNPLLDQPIVIRVTEGDIDIT